MDAVIPLVLYNAGHVVESDAVTLPVNFHGLLERVSRKASLRLTESNSEWELKSSGNSLCGHSQEVKSAAERAVQQKRVFRTTRRPLCPPAISAGFCYVDVSIFTGDW